MSPSSERSGGLNYISTSLLVIKLTRLLLSTLMSASVSTSAFLRLPSSIRLRVYAYLLSPGLGDNVTTINYTLSWPHLDNPSNTTFAGSTQIDLCVCPRRGICNEEGQYEPHIYQRYHCYGPKVHLNPSGQGLWLLQTAHGQFNILHPASATELECRPKVAILRTSKQIHNEALPLLYQNRNFLFLTGPCPRGRYQAFATLRWLQGLSSRARENVETLSLLVQPYEEDCLVNNASDSYAKLATYIKECVPGFKCLCLNVCVGDAHQTMNVFECVLQREGTSIVVRKHYGDFQTKTFECRESFLGRFAEAEM